MTGTRASGANPLIEFKAVHKSFFVRGQHFDVVRALDLAVAPGEFLCIVGPSGSGKSTLLNMVAGLGPPSTGAVSYGGRPVSEVNTEVAYLTQHDTLLPWRTVADNVGVPLELRGMAAATRRPLVQAAIDAIGLAGFEGHYPRQLSGGMRKRAMLARTLIQDPQAILMDEPFGPLDAQLKLMLQAELMALWARSRKTIMFVTHDIVEAITLADRVVVLSARPARVNLIETIAIPRPRDVHRTRFAPEFETHYERIWAAMELGALAQVPA